MNRRITILYSITDLARDGAQRQLLELLRGLNKEHYRPIVLTLHPHGPMEREFKAVPHIEVISLERKGKYDFAYLLSICRLLRKFRVDVVQPFLTPATFFVLLPALICRTPVKIVTERASQFKGKGRFGHGLYLKAEDLLSRFVDCAIPNSEAGRQYLIHRGISYNRIEVIYNGINLSRLTPDTERLKHIRNTLNLHNGGKVVGMMARLFPVKNHATFLKAAAIVSSVFPDTRFALLGDGPLRSSLKNMCHELGLSDKVIFYGEQQDVGTYLSAFDIVVLTSEAEGCSNSLLEAMALGKPVVATDVGGNREILNHDETGLLVPPRNHQVLAEAIISLLRHPETARSIGHRAQDRVISQFTVESMVHQYETLYESTLAKKNGYSKVKGRVR